MVVVESGAVAVVPQVVEAPILESIELHLFLILKVRALLHLKHT